jgi:[protein-PII] uridylyltransferase
MALAGASVVDAKIVTLTDGMALDSFLIQDATGVIFDNPSRLAKLAAFVEQALAGRLRLESELNQRRQTQPSRHRSFKVPPRVLINNNASARHTIIEVNGRDRVGLLYDITAAMTRLNLQIASAHISTYGERVVDVFYVKDVFGHKVEHERKIKAIREALASALASEAPSENGTATPPSAPATPAPAAQPATAAQ